MNDECCCRSKIYWCVMNRLVGKRDMVPGTDRIETWLPSATLSTNPSPSSAVSMVGAIALPRANRAAIKSAVRPIIMDGVECNPCVTQKWSEVKFVDFNMIRHNYHVD